MFCWPKKTTVRLGVASWLLLLDILWNQTRSQFVPSPENFDLGQEEGDSVDSLRDGRFDFGPVDDRFLEVGSALVKADLERDST